MHSLITRPFSVPLTLALLAAACASTPPPQKAASQQASPSSAPVSIPVVKTPDEKLNEFFAEAFQQEVDRNPMYQTMLGIKKDYGKWVDISDARAQEDHAIEKANLERLHTFDPSTLSDSNKISYKLFEYNTERSIRRFKWRFHTYPINQMFGMHADAAAFLINFHRIDDVKDAEAYIARLKGISPLFKQLEKNVRLRADKGILPPKFVFPHVIGSCQNLIVGAPFKAGASKDSTLLKDFKTKLGKIDSIDETTRSRLVEEAELVLKNTVEPAYTSIIAMLKELEKTASVDDGAWKFPEGDAYYENALQWTTTTQMTANDIHELGLAEVRRIHGEMREIMKKVKFRGNLQRFFRYMRKNPKFYYPNNDEGRDAYLARANEIIANMKAKLPELFNALPKADVVVKRVEPFREKAAGKAFYNRPAPDGSRPGFYYANLYDMTDMPTYQMEALAYHEAIPGHHMQIAIAQELEGLPRFRRFGGYTAYVEGWGLYSEYIPKELGFYEDPYSDFGRLAMELWRACRLVVDTGIHSKRWSRKKAIRYLKKNTPNPERDIIKAIERYIVMPSQATAYKVGMIKILELRAKAKATLGENFDLRAFHDVILTNGPVPLTVLENLVDDWVSEVLKTEGEPTHSAQSIKKQSVRHQMAAQ